MSVLATYRHHRNWSEEDVANQIGLSVQEYKDLESGVDTPDGELAMKLSELYLAPPQLFFPQSSAPQQTTIFSNCRFSGTGAAGYVNHMYQDQSKDKDAAIISLKNEIRELRKKNEELLGLLSKRKRG